MAKKSKKKTKASRVAPKAARKTKAKPKVLKKKVRALPDVVGEKYIIVSEDKALGEDGKFQSLSNRKTKLFASKEKALNMLDTMRADADMGILGDFLPDYAAARVVPARKLFANSYGICPTTFKITAEIGLKSNNYPTFKKIAGMAKSAIDIDLNEVRMEAAKNAKDFAKAQKALAKTQTSLRKRKEKLLAIVSQYG